MYVLQKMASGTRCTKQQLSFAEMSTHISRFCLLCKKCSQQVSTNNKPCDLMTSMNVPFDALVYKACRSDITRVLKDDSYIPRWQNFTDQTMSGKCCVVQCHENAIYSNIGMHCDLPTLFSEASLLCKFNSIPTPTPLCRHH